MLKRKTKEENKNKHRLKHSNIKKTEENIRGKGEKAKRERKADSSTGATKYHDRLGHENKRIPDKHVHRAVTSTLRERERERGR